MSFVRKPIRSLMLGVLALGVGSLAQNFLTSRPFLSDGLFLFVAGAVLLVLAFPKGGSVASLAQPALKRLPLAAQYKPLLFVLFAAGLNGYAATTITGSLMPLSGWCAFLVSLLFLILGVRSWDANQGLVAKKSKAPNWEIAAIVLITLVAAFLRFPDLNSLPFGVWFDEAMNGLDSIPVALGKSFPVYFEANFGRAALSFYVNALFFKLLGADLFALRLTSAVAGVLTVPVFYKMSRQFFSPYVALVGAFLVAVSRWHITFSRIAFDAVYLPLLACASIYFLAKGFRTKRTTDFALGGLAIGLGLNTYMAFRLFPVVILLFLAHKLIFEIRSFRSVWPGLVAFGLAAFLSAAPLLVYAYENQKAFTARTDTASVFAGKTPEQGQAALLANVQKHLLMFNLRGDPNGRHNIPGEPMLDQLTAVLFILGAGYSLWNWRKSAHFLFLATFGVLLLGGILSVDFEAPQALRSIGVLPAVFLFASLPLGFLWQTLEGFRASGTSALAGGPQGPDFLDRAVAWALSGRPTWAALGSVAILGSLAWVGNVNHFDYFSRYAANFASWNAFSTAETAIAYRLRNLKAEDYDIYISSLYAGHPSIRFLTPNAPHYEVFDVANGIPLRTQKKGVALFLEPQHLASYLQLKRYYPGGTFEEVTHQPYGGPPTMYAAIISREEIGRIQGLNEAVYPGTEKQGEPKMTGKVNRLEFDWSKGSQVPAPFVAEWKGTLYAPQYGSYQFSLEGTAKGSVYLDESPLVDTTGTPKAQVTLAKGNHAIRVEAAVAQGNESLRVQWQIPGGQLGVINSDYLYVPPVTNNGLLGKYYRTPDWQGAPAFTQIDPSIAFYFHLIPLPRPYSVEWTGKIYIPTAGRYTFGTESISISQLSIDGQLIVDNRVNNQYLVGGLNLQEGLHDLTLRYIDKDSFSHVYLYWTPPGKGRELVPSEYLFPPQGSYPPPSAIVAPPAEQQEPPTRAEMPPPAATPTPVPMPDVAGKRIEPSLQVGRKGNGDGELTEPRDLSVDKEGNLYAVDSGNFRIEKFGPDGKFLTKWGKKGDRDGEFQEPLAIVSDSQNQLLVLDSATGWIQRFDTDGKFKGKFGGPQAQLFHPRGMNIDAKDNLYIADTGGCRVVVYRASGEYVGTFGTKGGGDGQMLEPVDALVLDDGSLLVSDVGNKRIEKFDSGWKYVTQWKVPDAVAFNGEHLALAPDGSVFTTEPDRHRIVRYDRDMRPLGALGEAGEEPGQLRQPVGLFVDGTGKLFVADTYNNRIQIFEPNR